MKNNLDKIYQELGKDICLFPFLSVFYGIANSPHAAPCSLIHHWGIVDDNLIKSINSDKWINLRKNFTGSSCHTSEHCKTCSIAEKNGGSSSRQLNNQYFAEHLDCDIISEVKTIQENNFNVTRVKSLDYFPSNYCNYSCTMCTGDASSSRRVFEIKVLGRPNTKRIKKNKLTDDFYDILKNVEIVNFTGGETLLQKEVHTAIDYLIEHDLAKNMTISLLTNASKYPDELLDKFKNFKNVFYTISIDGINEVIEYQRRGCNWIETEQNAIKLNKAFGSVVNYVVTAINVFSFIETVDWLYQQNMDRVILSLVFDANKNMSVKVIPQELKNQLLHKLKANTARYPNNRFNDLITQMITILESNQYNPELFPEFKKAIVIEDSVSKRKLKEVVPEWIPYFDD